MASKEAIVIVIDIGFSSSKQPYEDDMTFIDLAKKCVSRIIKRKIFACASDELALVLLGSEESVNSLSYAHISEGFRLANPSWQMLKVLDEIKGTDVRDCDWIDALVVAMDILKCQTEHKKFSAKKIVLLVNLDNKVCNDKLDIIIHGLQSLDIELTALGVDLFAENEDDQKMEEDSALERESKNIRRVLNTFAGKTPKEKGIALLEHIITETGGMSCNFKDAMSQLENYQQKAVRPTPWNIFLEVGPDIQIPVSAFKKISEPTLPTWGKTLVDTSSKEQNEGSEVSFNTSTTSSVNTDNQPNQIPLDQDRVYMRDDQSAVDKSNLIKGYYFGSSAVPFNEHDEAQMTYKPDDRSLKLLGFASQSDVPRHLFIGVGTYYVTAQKNRPDAQPVLSALIRSLHEQKKVAIASKIYNKNCFPHIVALFPLIKKKYECLLLVTLPFAEEVNDLVFPRIVPQNKEPTCEELNAVDAFMDSMDLMSVAKDGEECEAFVLSELQNPARMNEFRSIEHRVLHPNDPLPPVSEDIKGLLENPFHSQQNYNSLLKTLKDKFEITAQPEMSTLKKKKFKNADADAIGEDEPQPSTSSARGSNANIASGIDNEITIGQESLVEVRTTTPDEDFKMLLARGHSFKSVCEQMQNVILNLVLKSFGAESFPKAEKALATLRESCMEKDVSVYNDWLPKFKKNLDDRDKLKFWESVGQGGLGLITSDENASSTVTSETAAAILRIEENENQNEEDGVDVDDLFDEM